MRAVRILRRGIGAAFLAAGIAACGANGPLELPSTPGLGVSGSSAGLLGTWRLVSLQQAGPSMVGIAEPERFQAEFQADGRLALVADCNLCSGTFTAGEDTLSVTPMACTRAACPSMPLDTTYVSLVGAATAWEVAGDGLELRSASGTLRFRR